MSYYTESVSTVHGILKEFRAWEAPIRPMSEADLIYANYTYEDYRGQAIVFFIHDGRIYEVNGSHCSCHGLEDQWEPEEVTPAYLKEMIVRDGCRLQHFPGLKDALKDFLKGVS